MKKRQGRTKHNVPSTYSKYIWIAVSLCILSALILLLVLKDGDFVGRLYSGPPCVNRPAYANVCPGDYRSENPSRPTTSILVNTCTPTRYCEYRCTSGYKKAGNSCVANTATNTFACSGSTFSGATLCAGDNQGLTAAQTNSLVSACSNAQKCEYTCNSGFEKVENECWPVVELRQKNLQTITHQGLTLKIMHELNQPKTVYKVMENLQVNVPPGMPENMVMVIYLNANDIILNCDGNTLLNTNLNPVSDLGGPFGISTHYGAVFQNIQIRSCIINHFLTGMVLDSFNEGLIEFNTISSEHGISGGGSNNVISNNVIHTNDNGFQWYSGHNNIFQKNRVCGGITNRILVNCHGFDSGLENKFDTFSFFPEGCSSIWPEETDYAVCDTQCIPIRFDSKVVFKSYHNTYITAKGTNYATDNMRAESSITPKAKFNLKKASGNTGDVSLDQDLALWSLGDSRYVTAQNEADGRDLTASATYLQGWEKFTVRKADGSSGQLCDGDQITLKSFHTKYVVAEPSGIVKNNREVASTSETFTVSIVD